MAPSTFHPFPDLPTELQLKIWDYAISQKPRTVVIETKSHCGCQAPYVDDHAQYDVSISSKTPFPALLQVDRKSRAYCMKGFEALTGICENCNSKKCIRYKYPSAVPLNPSIDTLFLLDGDQDRHWERSGHGSILLLSKATDTAVLEKIKFLAIDFCLSHQVTTSSFCHNWIVQRQQQRHYGQRPRDPQWVIRPQVFDILLKLKGLEVLYVMDRYPRHHPGSFTLRIDQPSEYKNARVVALVNRLRSAIAEEKKKDPNLVRKMPRVRIAHCSGAEAVMVLDRMRKMPISNWDEEIPSEPVQTPEPPHLAHVHAPYPHHIQHIQY